MNLSKITVFKIFLFLFILLFLITSCEPEEIPFDERVTTDQHIKKIGTTGDQSSITEIIQTYKAYVSSTSSNCKISNLLEIA